MGQETSCNVYKTSIGTQTSVEPPQGLDPEGFWTRRTYEHSLLQVDVVFFWLFLYNQGE